MLSWPHRGAPEEQHKVPGGPCQSSAGDNREESAPGPQSVLVPEGEVTRHDERGRKVPGTAKQDGSL